MADMIDGRLTIVEDANGARDLLLSSLVHLHASTSQHQSKVPLTLFGHISGQHCISVIDITIDLLKLHGDTDFKI
jgi:hypothetical protein